MQSAVDNPAGTSRFGGNSAVLERALGAVFESLRPCGPRRWMVSAGSVELELRLGSHWIDVVAPASPALGESPEDWLAANAVTAAGLKYSQDSDTVRLIATLPLDHPTLFESRLRAAYRSLAPAPEHRPSTAAAPTTTPDELRDLLVQASLSVIERKTDLAVAIDCGPLVLHAVVREDGGGIRAGLELSEIPADADPVVRRAIAAILWRTNAAVRLARAEIHPSKAKTRASLQAYLAGPPVVSDLRHLLGSLTVAARMCAREVESLVRDERLARVFLAQTQRTESSANPKRARQQRFSTKGESS